MSYRPQFKNKSGNMVDLPLDAATVNGKATLTGGSQTTTSTADGGSNVYTFTKSDGSTSTFTVKNGSKGSTGATGPKGATGATGATGVGVSSISQTTTSSADAGTNVITCKLTDGTTTTFNIKNGSKGSTGATGATPTIKVSAGSNINSVGTPTVTASTSGTTTTFTFNYLKGATGATGPQGPAGSSDISLVGYIDNSSISVGTRTLLIVPIYNGSILTVKATMANGTTASTTASLEGAVGLRTCDWGVYLGGNHILSANSGTTIKSVTLTCGSTRFLIYELEY